jgi:hypothetical protein
MQGLMPGTAAGNQRDLAWFGRIYAPDKMRLSVELDNIGMGFGKAEQAFVKQCIGGIDEFFHDRDS